MNNLRGAIAGALLCAMAVSAHANPSSAELRVLGVGSYSPFGSSSSYEGRDRFNNGDPTTGIVYTNNASGAQVTGGYNPSTFSPGSELSGAASGFIGSLGAGGLGFQRQDATLSNSNLTPAGYDTKALTLGVKYLDPAAVTGASYQGLLQKANGFDAFTVWDFITPDAGAAYGMRVAGGPAADGSFQDRLDLRVLTTLGGATTVNFERVSRTAGGTFSRSLLGSVAFSDVYGGNLSDIDFIALDLQRDTPASGGNTPVHASFKLLDASLDANGDPKVLASFDFANSLPVIFSDQTYATLSAVASWNVPTVAAVPEPSTYALMALGMLATAFVARRRRTA